jgi:hypothetical protein
MNDEPPEESLEDAIENYNAWIDLALGKAEQDDWDSVREMVQETPFAASYLYLLVRAYRDLLQRYEQLEAEKGPNGPSASAAR